MVLYHISNKYYADNSVVNIDDFEGEVTCYYRDRADHNWIDDFLSETKPQNVPNRRRAIFCFSSPCHCVYFKKAEIQSGQEVFLYKAEMNVEFGYPMRLIRNLETNPDNEQIKNAVRMEYWNPTLDWKVKEYIGESMTILEHLKIKTFDISIGNIDYYHDIDISNRFLKNISNN